MCELKKIKALICTFFSQYIGIKAEMVDAEVKPPLSRHLPLPVTARVIVDQLLFIRHPEQLTKLSASLLELVCVIIFFDIVVLVVLCDDALQQNEKRQIEVMS